MSAASPKPSPRPAEPVELSHCEPGDPCERTLVISPEGGVWFSALCAEMLPVAEALTENLPPLK